MLRQSISQNRADTVVVNETQSLTNVNGVEPVTSSHWARDAPPVDEPENKVAPNGAYANQRINTSISQQRTTAYISYGDV